MATNVVDMTALLPGRRPISIFVLVEAWLVAFCDCVDLVILYPKSIVARLAHDRRINYRYRLGKLHLIPELIVQIYRREEQILQERQVITR